ncbi:MAG: nickel pincer cofactor biosynthesis protein LarC [Desulfobacterales bacterium]|nr:nickel pincer cofactor biosynthesis protein LarC [Desulfobacterales bacterium]
MKIAYFDCFAGASGDMILGALLDAGLPIERLREEVAKLNLSHYALDVAKVVKKGIGGSQAQIVIDQDHHDHHHRHLSHIREIIATSDLDDAIKTRSIDIFVRLAEAEARVHRSTVEAVHFHEVGAMDAIIDVVGAVVGLHVLEIDKVFCSPLHVGSGTIECAHGTLPVPAPATAELIKGRPAYSTGVAGELLTPTGAAILTTLAAGFGPMPAMTVGQVGYGAGTADPGIPNLLRVAIGEARDDVGDYEVEQTALIETNIDDMNPQLYDHLMGRLLDEGALDVFLTAVQMKKNRPGTLLSVICRSNAVGKLADILMRETTTIGLRWRVENRIMAAREIRRIDTVHGPVAVKLARSNGRIINLTPEYDDCKRVALEKGLPLKKVLDEVRAAALQAIDDGDTLKAAPD